MFGGKNYVRNAEKSVRTSGENLEFVPAFRFEKDFSACGFSYPVALHGFGFFGPVESVEFIEEFFRVRGYFEEPLRKVALDNLRSASFAMPVGNLFVCKHRVAARTPVYGRFLSVCKPVFVKFKE